MLTLFHSPRSRSTRIVALIAELGVLDAVEIETVSVRRVDGSGAADPRNPHPEGKVPFLQEDGVAIRESSAIVEYLAERFPAAGLGVPPGDPRRGAYLSWLSWYAGVMEPVFVLEAAGLDHPATRATFRGRPEMLARLADALDAGPYLLGERYTAADLLLQSAFGWFGKTGNAAIDAWIDRCAERPGTAFAAEFDRKQMAA
ncbi:glutathione S-transferase family protein [Mangrovibrevibacter kandeliae]|uniref:glutathione S-transferase family protein n=1 Tax=Mangrovibrevibacter kandeliae TaxID=2968473 RepID=UPI0021175AA8|nr:glutathione S-transferase family protein [Aurantimonas sp. CSK15Z-1]MCQ8782312.1 glutathione S-transferase family protein [Aurantimonas sp. CSK15Z-1]